MCAYARMYVCMFRNKSKLVNYRLVSDGGSYYIHNNATFPSIRLLLAHYKTTPINAAVNTHLLNPVLSQEPLPPSPEDTYVIMEKGQWCLMAGAYWMAAFPGVRCA